MLIWKPDTCKCEINLTDRVFVTKCKLHNSSTDIKDVEDHNKSFNLKYGNVEITKEQIAQILSDKQNENERIKNLS